MKNTTLPAQTLLIAGLASLLVVACTPATPDAPSEQASAAKRWRCGDLLLETQTRGDELLLHLPGATHRLRAEPSTSGARYGNAADTQFWSKGDSAALFRRHHGGPEWECTRTQQRSPWISAGDENVRLRAAGHEPAWVVEADANGAVRLTLDYGKTTLRFNDRQSLPARQGFSAQNGAHRLRVSVTNDNGCTDSMSGTHFPLTVRLRLDGQAPLTGCGRRYPEN